MWNYGKQSFGCKERNSRSKIPRVRVSMPGTVAELSVVVMKLL
jgi:hypothetical protein